MAPTDPLLPPPAPAPAAPTPAAPPRPGRRRLWRRLLVIGAFVAAGVFVAQRVGEWRAALAADEAALEAHFERQEQALRRVPPLTRAERAALRRPSYAEHLALARRLGVAPSETRDSLAARAGLVPLATTDAYAVTPARYGLARATPGTRAALDSVGARFHAALGARGLPRFRITVTSVLRSTEDQRGLRLVNPNAARGRSSHEYGTSFDVAYRRYAPGDGPGADPTAPPRPPGLPSFLAAATAPARAFRLGDHARTLADVHAERLDALLARELLGLGERGVLVALREEQQPVYHVTVARGVASGE